MNKIKKTFKTSIIKVPESDHSHIIMYSNIASRRILQKLLHYFLIQRYRGRCLPKCGVLQIWTYLKPVSIHSEHSFDPHALKIDFKKIENSKSTSCFLDIRMGYHTDLGFPELTRFELCEKYREIPSSICFTFSTNLPSVIILT